MKVSVTKDEPDFTPFEITIRVESRAEAAALAAVAQANIRVPERLDMDGAFRRGSLFQAASAYTVTHVLGAIWAALVQAGRHNGGYFWEGG